MSHALTGDAELAGVKEGVKTILSEELERAGNNQSPDFLTFMLGASTQEIRGLGCSHAERAQLAAWLTPLNERKAKVLHAYRLIEGAYVCYDTPKKFPMIVVRRVLARLLSEAGLKSSSGKMSDYIKANYFCIQARVNNKRPWECLRNYPVPQLGGIWFPTPRIQLSADAGPLLRKLMLKRREADFQVPPMRRACDELARLVAYKLNLKLDLPLKQWLREGRSGDELVQAIEEAPIFRKRGVGSLSYLADLAL